MKKNNKSLIDYLRNDKIKSLIFFLGLYIWTLVIHDNESNYYTDNIHGSIFPFVILPFIPYWIVKFIFGLITKMKTGNFKWTFNKYLYLIPFTLWATLIIMMYYITEVM